MLILQVISWYSALYNKKPISLLKACLPNQFIKNFSRYCSIALAASEITSMSVDELMESFGMAFVPYVARFGYGRSEFSTLDFVSHVL